VVTRGKWKGRREVGACLGGGSTMTQRELLVHKKGKGGGEPVTMRVEQLTRCRLEGKARWANG